MKNENVFDDFDFGKALTRSLEQAVAYANGDKSKARIVVREIATPTYDGEDIRRMRDDLHLSQNGLALAIGVSKRTVEAWEAGKSKPSNVANKLLYLIERKRELLDLLILPKTS
jgi:putative transcriptional regulator